MSNRVHYSRGISGILNSAGGGDASARGEVDRVYEGLVIDIILDETHPEYTKPDGYYVGAAKVRIFDVNLMIEDDSLPWAVPFDFGLYEMPLIGEHVVLFKIRGTFYYTKRLPVARRLQENGMLNLNKVLVSRPQNGASLATESEQSTESHKFGEYWRPDSRVRQLKHFEGDMILQGRKGHSIRFGSSKQDPTTDGLAPSLLLRVGQAKGIEEDDISIKTVFGIILEEINKDASSIWMVSDQIVPFEPATINADSFYRSIANPPSVFDKASIITTSSRIVLNAKKTHIMLFANEEIYLNSIKRTSIDTDEHILLTARLDIFNRASRNIENVTDVDFIINAGKDLYSVTENITSIIARKSYIGSEKNDTEPLVGGTSLSKFLARFILALINTSVPNPPRVGTQGPNTALHVITPMGPGVLAPPVVKALLDLYKELTPINGGQENFPTGFAGAPFNSNDNFVMLKNETPVIERNEFVEGASYELIESEWILANPYYRVL
jgi:hypothetical protein